jgi:CubicO group peptidase (beta-lactamase class C family)
LRDYARLARLLANNGAWEGRQLIPRQWLLDATTVRPGDGHPAPGVATSEPGGLREPLALWFAVLQQLGQ